MLTVTAVAQKQIKARLQSMNKASDLIVRLIPSPLNPGKWKMILDRERSEDKVVESEDGIKILLIGAELAPSLHEMIIDFRKTPKGTGFAIYKLRSNP